jgi:hypothetical protein
MLCVRSAADLWTELSKIDVVVPRRSKGRTKDHVELYSIVRLLTSIPESSLKYPLELAKSERPDFVLGLDRLEVGIELVEAVPENEAHKNFLRDKIDGPEFHFIDRARISDAKKTTQALIDEIVADEPGEAWEGNSAEVDWCEAMLHFVEKKIAVASRQGFRRFEQNWLLIYDNWPCPPLNYEIVMPKLHGCLLKTRAWETFDRIYIQDDSRLLELGKEQFGEWKAKHLRPEA